MNCLSPILIINPSVKSQAEFLRLVVHRNQALYHFPKDLSFLADKRFWAQSAREYIHKQEDTELTYVVTLDGIIIPLYMFVPCNKCTLCIESKRRDLSNRAFLEGTCYDTQGVFVTLTYNDNYQPDELDVTHLQKFFKRLRINIHRYTNTPINDIRLRYLACGEYGKHGRAHYHFMLWNVPKILAPSGLHFLLKLSWSELHKSVERTQELWRLTLLNGRYVCYDYLIDVPNQFGFVHSQPIGSKVAYYVTKYMSKSFANGKPGFIVQSTRHGGIGTPFLSRLQKLYDYDNNPVIEVLDKYSGQIRTLTVPRYLDLKLRKLTYNDWPVDFKNTVRLVIALYSFYSLFSYGSYVGYLKRYKHLLDVLFETFPSLRQKFPSDFVPDYDSVFDVFFKNVLDSREEIRTYLRDCPFVLLEIVETRVSDILLQMREHTDSVQLYYDRLAKRIEFALRDPLTDDQLLAKAYGIEQRNIASGHRERI